VQNLYNLANRSAEELLDYSAANSIGFIPWFPLATGELAKPGSPLAELAARHGASPSQLALAWLLHRSSPPSCCLSPARPASRCLRASTPPWSPRYAKPRSAKP
jgi:aryl-alcohol dehydrogenase-like predicted oxidoreductase